MTPKNMELKLKSAITKITPNEFDSILSDCNQQERKVIVLKKMTRKNQWLSFAAGVAAALVLFVGGAFGFQTYRANTGIDSTISLDVNPSVEILTNKHEKVLAVNAHNEDGKKIIGDMNFEKSDLDVAVNALIGSMLRNGYISELANSILVSVENHDAAKAARLQKELSDEIAALLKNDAFSGSVISQTVTEQDQVKELSATYEISTGKAKLIKQLIALNPTYTFDALSELSINELNILHERYDNAEAPTITATGSASAKAYIGAEAAKKAAYAHAKISASSAKSVDVEMDVENGVMVYEVDFYAAGYEYDYDIHATKGTVLKSQKDRDDDYFEALNNANQQIQKPQSSNQQNNQQNKDQVSVSSKKQTATSSTKTTNDKISKSKAKSIALSHAGLTSADLIDYEIEYDVDDGIALYEISFEANGYEYEYDIRASDGKIIKSEKERDD